MKSVCPTETTPKALQTPRRERKGDTGEERHLEVYSEKNQQVTLKKIKQNNNRIFSGQQFFNKQQQETQHKNTRVTLDWNEACAVIFHYWRTLLTRYKCRMLFSVKIYTIINTVLVILIIYKIEKKIKVMLTPRSGAAGRSSRPISWRSWRKPSRRRIILTCTRGRCSPWRRSYLRTEYRWRH